jgi:MFS family permease
VEGLTSAATTLLIVGIFFYTSNVFHWGLRRNFCLAAAQGMVYVIGALLADPLAGRLGRRRGLTVIYITMMLLASVGLLPLGPGVIVTVLLLYTALAGASWPALESLVSSGAEAGELSRRLGTYNLVWAATSGVAYALNGPIILHCRAGVFLIPLSAHGLSALTVFLGQRLPPAAVAESPVAAPEPSRTPAAELDLLAHRRLALWLSRLALPATYMVIYSLSAIMPLLPAMSKLSISAKTAAASVWMASRCITFVVLGMTTAWHTRPKLLLWSALAMFVSFLGTVVRPSDLAGIGTQFDLLSMLLWQVPLGVALGAIYTASLYFGMVLSQGSTEHGGYHEALIGLGSILGPGAGAISLFFFNDLRAGLAAVAAIVAASVLAATVANLRFRGSEQGESLELPAGRH